MVVARIGSPSVGGATSGTSFPTSNPQSPTKDKLQLLVVCSTRTTATITLSGLSGWTLLGSAAGFRSPVHTQVWLYGRIVPADGAAAPTIVTSGSTRLRWMIEEWDGLSTSLPTTGIPETWTIANSSGGGGATVSHTETAEVDNEWVYAVLAGRAGSAGTVTFTWDSDLTADQNTATGSNSYLYTATGSIPLAGGTLVASFNVVNAQADGMDTLGMIGFAPFTEDPPPDPEYPGVVMDAGTEDPVVDMNVMEAGVKDPVTAISKMSGGTEVPLYP